MRALWVMRSLTYKHAPIVVPPLFTFKDLLNGNCDGYLGLLWNLVKLPVDDHPAQEHEEPSSAAISSWPSPAVANSSWSLSPASISSWSSSPAGSPSPAHEHEEEDKAGRHPLELVVDRKVRVQVQHLDKSGQENSNYVLFDICFRMFPQRQHTVEDE